MNALLCRAAVSAALLSLLGCASSPAPNAAAAGTPRKTIVLVEAKGDAPELDRFIPRFLSAASDRGLGAIVDARLSGARLADVFSTGEAGTEFRKAWPGDVYIGVLLAPCRIRARPGHIYNPQSSPGGVGVADVVVAYEADCNATLTVVTGPGAAQKSIDVTGRNGTAEVSTADTEAEAQAAEDAAETAAKKIGSLVR